MMANFKELVDHFTAKNDCPVESKHAIASKKFLIVMLFVGIATGMQWVGKFSGAYTDFMQNMCVAAVAAFVYQDKKQIEAKGKKDDKEGMG